MDQMGKEELISIIVPVYNAKEYLPRCIDSILNQTYNNIELILIDDGSNDGSEIICDTYAQQDRRIRVVHQKNSGQATARNVGLSITTGKYIGFVDSDDAILPTMYQALMRALVGAKADIACCSYKKTLFENFTAIENVEQPPEELKIVDVDNIPSEICKGKDLKTYVWDKLFKKSLFDCIQFPDGKIFEDTTVVCDVLCKASRIVITNQILYMYTVRPGSTMTLKTRKRYLDEFSAYSHQLSLLAGRCPKELYRLEIKEAEVIRYYIELCDEKENNKDMLTVMKNNYRKNYLKILKENNKPLQTKIAITFCMLFPGVYVKVMRIIRKKNGKNNIY